MIRLIFGTLYLAVHVVAPDVAGQTSVPARRHDAQLVSISGTLTAPATIHFNALNLPLADGTCLTARYEWDFGDPAARYNRLVGWNAAHTYDRPGRYAIRLTMISESGAIQYFEQLITIHPSRGRTIHVAANGNDGADGSAPARAVRNVWRAVQLAGDGSRILLRRGDRFDVPGTIELRQRDLVLGTYGSTQIAMDWLVHLAAPSHATIRYIGARNGSPIIEAHERSSDIVIEDIAFDTIYSRDAEKKNIPSAVRPTGVNFTARRCVFLNVCDGLTANARPRGVLMQDCAAPLVTGIRGYLAWIEGSDQAYLGNSAANSTREAVMRISYTGAQRVLIAGNHLTNLDRTDVDRIDTAKNALTVHSGSHMYVAGNTFRTGPAIIGPLGDGDGFRQPNQKLAWIVFEDNLVRDSMLKVSHGTERAMIRNNRFWTDGRAAINIEGFNREYKRGSKDVVIAHNTAVNASSKGSFLRVGGKVDGIRLLNNLYAAARLAPGSDSTAVVYVGQNDLGSFTEIRGNIWPVAPPQSYAAGGVFYVWPSWSDPRGYIKLVAWNQQSSGDDVQLDISLDGQLRAKMMDADVRKRMPGVSHDAAGKRRDENKTSPGAWD